MGVQTVAKGALPQSSDVNQYALLFQGKVDVGTVTLPGQTSVPSTAPTVTLSSGSITGTGYQWGFYWITGTVNDSGTVSVTGKTPASPYSTAQSLTSERATISISGMTIPSAVIGWGVVRNKSAGSTWYEVPGSEQFGNSDGTSIPVTYVDETADANLVTAAPSSNTTGTSLSGNIDAQTLNGLPQSDYFRTDSGAPNPQTVANPIVLPVITTTTVGTFLFGSNSGNTDIDIFRTDGSSIFYLLPWGKGAGANTSIDTLAFGTGGGTLIVRTPKNTIDDGSGNMTVAGSINGVDVAQLVGTQTFTSSTTWTVPLGVTRVYVKVWGAGGGACNVNYNSNGAPAGQSGSNGTYGEGWYALNGATTVSVTVGAGGAYAYETTAGTGGSSSFGSFLAEGGGAGGQYNVSGTNYNQITPQDGSIPGGGGVWGTSSTGPGNGGRGQVTIYW